MKPNSHKQSNEASSQPPSPLQVQNSIVTAMEQAGLNQPLVESAPIPIFQQLVTEWVWELAEIECQLDDDWPHVAATLCDLHDATQVRADLTALYYEAQQLANAHQTLNAWKARELERTYRQMLEVIGHHQRPAHPNRSLL